MEMDKSGDMAEGILPMKLLQGSLFAQAESVRRALTCAGFADFIINIDLSALSLRTGKRFRALKRDF